MQSSVILSGVLDEDLLRKSINYLVARHASLRTVYRVARSGLEQVVLPFEPAPLTIHTCEKISVNELISNLRNIPFDLARGPLFRPDLIRIGVEESILTFTMHHIAVDGPSVNLLYRDLSVAYDSYLTGDEPQLAPAPNPIEYNNRQNLNDLAKEIAYWERALAGAPECSLAVDHDVDRRANDSYAISSKIPASVLGQLAAVARSHRSSTYIVLLALYAVLLGEHSGTTDMVIAMPVTGRLHRDVDELVGYLVNFVPVRIQYSPSDNLSGIIELARESCLAASENAALPFERIVAVSKVARSSSRSPLAQTLLNQPPAVGVPRFGGLVVDRWIAKYAATRLELECHVLRYQGDTEFLLLGAQDLFEYETIEELSREFVGIMDRWSTRPEKAVRKIL